MLAYLLFLLPILSSSKTFEDVYSFLKLRYSFIYANNNKTECDDIKRRLDNITRNYESYCNEMSESMDEKLCKDIVNALDSYYFTDKYDIDDNLKKIPRNVEVVYLISSIDQIDINFNKLIDKKKVVFYDPYLNNQDNYYSNDNGYSQMQIFIRSFFNTNYIDGKKHKQKKTEEDFRTVNIVGNIKYKVSYMVIAYYFVNIKFYDLNIDTLVLYNSFIHKNSFQIRTTNLITNILSHARLIDDIDTITSNNLIHVHQYGIFYDYDENFRVKNDENFDYDEDIVDKDYRIVFQKDRWELLYKKHGEDTDYTFNEYYYFPYQFCDIFNVIIRAFNFDLNVSDSSVEETKGVNITVTTLNDYFTPDRAILLGSYEMKITTSGFWSELKKKPQIIVCLDDETKLVQTDVSVDVQSLYSYSPKAPLPTATINPSPSFNYEKISIIYTFTNYSHCKMFRDKFDTFTMNYTEICHDEKDYEDCCAQFSSYGEYLCSNGNDINTKLKLISEDTDSLIIVDAIGDLNIDFNNLNDRMNVVLFGSELDDDTTLEKFIRNIHKKPIDEILKKIRNQHKMEDDQLFNVFLQGNISEKVSFLTLGSLNVSFINEILNINTLAMFNSVINDNSKPIHTKYLVVDTETHSHIITNTNPIDLINVDQYGISIIDEEIENDPSSSEYIPYYTRISFENDRWKFQIKEHYEDEYIKDGFFLPYSYANTFNLIVKSLDFDLHVDNPIIELTKPVNITVKNSLNSLYLFQSKDIKMTITTSGYWEQSKKKATVTVSLIDEIEVIAPKNVKVHREKLYSYTLKVQNHSNPFIYPVISYFCINSMASKCLEDQVEFYKIKENYKEICKEKNYYDSFDGRYEECCSFYKSYGEFINSAGTDVNKRLSEIPNTTDTLYIMNYMNGLTFDFNHLINQMNVILANLNENEIDVRKRFSITKKKKSNVQPLAINLIGNIKEKVSFLSVISCKLNIEEKDLDVNTLFLSGSNIAGTQKSIRTTNLIVDQFSQNEIMNNILEINERELIRVDQYGYAINRAYSSLKASYNDNDFVNKDFRINFQNDRWLLDAREHGKSDEYKPFNDGDSPFGFVPYSYCNSFNLLVKAFDFDFYVEGSLINNVKQSNVTVLDFSVVVERTKLFKPREVKVTSSGNWIGVKEKPTMIITIDDDEVTLDTSSVKDTEIRKESLYVYKTKSQGNSDDSDDSIHNNKALYIIIGCVCGGILLVVIIILISCVVYKKKNNNDGFYTKTVPSYTYNQILNN